MKKQSNLTLFILALGGILLLPNCFGPKDTFEPQLSEAASETVATGSAAQSADTVQGLSDLIASNAVVVIDFYAPWCGPCKYMSPIIDELSNERSDITFVKVDIDKLDKADTAFSLGGVEINISSVPTFYVFKNGAYAGELHGGMKKEAFAEKLNVALSK